MTSLGEVFGAGGLLARHLPGYRPRPGQLQMAVRVLESLEKPGHLVVEAGTGVGKSLAYLLPMLIAKRADGPLVVSTGTIALQEQLMDKDLPVVARCLNRPIKAALAVGRGHYLCERRLERLSTRLELLAETDEELEILRRLAREAESRHMMKRGSIPGRLSDATWSQICSEPGVCGNAACRERPCSYVKARQQLRGADVIIVNHSLLFVHLGLRQSGGAILPTFSRLVLDEAHHCPDTATEQMGIHVGNSRVRFLLDQLHRPKSGKGFLDRVRPRPVTLIQGVEQLRELSEQFFADLHQWTAKNAPDNGRLRVPPGLEDPLSPALKALSTLLGNWAGSADDDQERREFLNYSTRAAALADEVSLFMRQAVQAAAYWVEAADGRGGMPKITAHAAMLDVSDRLRGLLFESCPTVVMASATLCAGGRGDFGYFTARMGAESAQTLAVESPFDYANQALLSTTAADPEPGDPEYLRRLPDEVWRCIERTEGGAFVLVTNFQHLRLLHSALAERAARRGYPLLAQGISGGRTAILDEFRRSGRAVLIGNSSFWEGVDVPGRGLRNVIITRLPFEVPSHPLQQARHELVEARGGNPFRECSLPHAIMKFKQGFGRLIRRTTDIGMVCVLDSRLHRKAYGRMFLHALPSLRCLVDEEPDEAFLARIREAE